MGAHSGTGVFCKLYPPEEEGRCCYRAVCRTESCRKSYIGETGLLLADRKKRHNYDKKSAIHEHQIRCGPSKERGFDFVMISKEVEPLEIFLIRSEKPDLNRDSGVGLYCFP